MQDRKNIRRKWCILMINIGMDFGSTYTTVSVFREDTQLLEALSLSQGSPYIPSVAALAKNQFEFGRAAKSRTAKKELLYIKPLK